MLLVTVRVNERKWKNEKERKNKNVREKNGVNYWSKHVSTFISTWIVMGGNKKKHTFDWKIIGVIRSKCFFSYNFYSKTDNQSHSRWICFLIDIKIPVYRCNHNISEFSHQCVFCFFWFGGKSFDYFSLNKLEGQLWTGRRVWRVDLPRLKNVAH